MRQRGIPLRAAIALALVACKGERPAPSVTTSDAAAPAPAPAVAPSAWPSSLGYDAALPPLFGDTTETDCAHEADASLAALGLISGCASCIAGAKRFMGGCKRDPTGTWSVTLSIPTLHVTHGAPSRYGFRIQVVRRPTCGDGDMCVEYESDPGLIMAVETSAADDIGWSTFDYDHDGTPEILVRGGRDGWVLTAKKDETTGVWQVVPYAPSAPLAITGIEDVDHDGRPDLHHRGKYGVGAMFVAHSLPDGKFSLDDEVATRAFAEGCPPAGVELAGILRLEARDAVHRIACARARGKSAADVRSALASDASPAGTDAAPGARIPSVLDQAIAVTPPLVLR